MWATSSYEWNPYELTAVKAQQDEADMSTDVGSVGAVGDATKTDSQPKTDPQPPEERRATTKLRRVPACQVGGACAHSWKQAHFASCHCWRQRTPRPCGRLMPADASAATGTSVLLQVAGCGVDLSDLKQYYRRYRICLAHCNQPTMMLNNQCSRFCQVRGATHTTSSQMQAVRI